MKVLFSLSSIHSHTTYICHSQLFVSSEITAARRANFQFYYDSLSKMAAKGWFKVPTVSNRAVLLVYPTFLIFLVRVRKWWVSLALISVSTYCVFVSINVLVTRLLFANSISHYMRVCQFQ